VPEAAFDNIISHSDFVSCWRKRHILRNSTYDVAHELLRLFTDRCDIKRNILHLEITLLVVRINFDRLASFIGFVFGIQFAYQTAQKVVVQRDFGSVEFRGGESIPATTRVFLNAISAYRVPRCREADWDWLSPKSSSKHTEAPYRWKANWARDRVSRLCYRYKYNL
jgi:hypothetical protein